MRGAECDTLATLLWKSYGKVLSRVRGGLGRQADEVLLAPLQERLDEQQAPELCQAAAARPREESATDSKQWRSLRALRLRTQSRGARRPPPRPDDQVLPC